MSANPNSHSFVSMGRRQFHFDKLGLDRIPWTIVPEFDLYNPNCHSRVAKFVAEPWVHRLLRNKKEKNMRMKTRTLFGYFTNLGGEMAKRIDQMDQWKGWKIPRGFLKEWAQWWIGQDQFPAAHGMYEATTGEAGSQRRLPNRRAAGQLGLLCFSSHF